MVRYAERECDDCGVILPAPELTRINNRVLSSSTSRRRIYSGVRGGIGIGGGSSETYKVQSLNLCDTCLGYHIALKRRERFRSTVSKLFIAGIAVAAFVMIFKRGESSSSSDYTTINDNGMNYQAANTADNSSIYTPPSQLIDNDTAPSPELTNDAQDTEIQNTQSQPSENAAPNPYNLTTKQVADAVMVVMPQALESGEAQAWESGKGNGYVVPSAAQTYPGLTCRNVYVTINYRGEKSQSEPQRWCKPLEGRDWKISPEGT